MKEAEQYILNLDCSNLRAYPQSRKLAKQLQRYPQEIISLMDHCLAEFCSEIFGDEDDFDHNMMVGWEDFFFIFVVFALISF